MWRSVGKTPGLEISEKYDPFSFMYMDMIVSAYTPLIIRTGYLFQDILGQNFSDFLNANSVNPMKSQHWTIDKFDYLPVSVQFSRSVVSDSLQPDEPQRARPPCPSPTSTVHPNLCPLSR